MSKLHKVLWALIAAFTIFNLCVIVNAYAEDRVLFDDTEPQTNREYTLQELMDGKHWDPDFVVPSAVYKDPTDWTHDLQEEQKLIQYLWKQIDKK